MSTWARVKKKFVPIERWVTAQTNDYWYRNPLVREPNGCRDHYLSLYESAIVKVFEEIDEYELVTGCAIDRDWLNQLALQTQVVVKSSELCFAHGRILYSALSSYCRTNPELSHIRVCETGTARGFSATCMAKALDDNSKNGLIVTYDNLPHDHKMYWNTVSDHDRGKITRAQLLDQWSILADNYIFFQQGDTRVQLSRHGMRRIHFAFLDGAHTYEDVMFEFLKIKDAQLSGDIIVFDDYTPRIFPGLVNAVDEICQKYSYRRRDLVASDARGYVIATKE